MRQFSRVCLLLHAILYWTALAALVLITLSLGGQVFWRYVLGDPLYHSDEIAQSALVWLTFSAAAILHRERGHIEVEVFWDMLPVKLRNITSAVLEVAVIIALAMVAYEILKARPMMLRVIYGTLEVPKFYIHYLPLLISCGASILFSIERLLQALREGGDRLHRPIKLTGAG